MIKALVINKEELKKGNMVSRWVELPKTKEDLTNELSQIGINYMDDLKQYHISGCKSDMPALDNRVNSTTDLETLNVIAATLSDADSITKKRLNTVLSLYPEPDLADVIANYDDHWHYSFIQSHEELGAYALEQMGINLLDHPYYLSSCIDFHALGTTIAQINGGAISEYGYIQGGSELKLDMELTQENTPLDNGFYIEVDIENRQTEKFKLIRLTLSETELSHNLLDIDIIDYSKENTSITICGYDNYQLSVYLNNDMDLLQMNCLALKISQMDDIELDTYGQIVCQGTGYTEPSVDFLLDIAENIDKFDIFPEIENAADLGRHYYESANPGASPLTEQEYEHQGKSILDKQGGIFTDIGYLYCTDVDYTPKQGKIPRVTNPQWPAAAALLENGITYHFPMHLDQSDTPLEQWQKNPGYQIKEISSNISGIPMDQAAMNCQPAELNGLCEKISRFSMSDLQKYKAMAVVAYDPSCAFLNELADNIGRYEHLPGIHRAEDLGAYCLDQRLVEDFDYESENLGDDLLHMCTLGGNFMDEHGGTFTDYGFIYCKDKDYQLTQGRFKTMDEMIQDGHNLMF